MNLVDRKIVDEMYRDGWLYTSFGEYWRRKYGYKVCKVPLNAGFTCPNWDGRIADDGCAFCPNFARQFTYDSFRTVINKSWKEQVTHQVKHYKGMGAGDKAMVYIAFATNTYAPLKDLKKIYDAALDHKDVIGLSIGTRPDCLPDEVLDLMGDYVKQGYEIWVEVGQQTPHYHTLKDIDRGHGFAESIRVVREAHKRGIKVIFFNISGMPGESPDEMVETARILSALEIDAVKQYPLIVMKGTRLAEDYIKGKYRPLGRMEYVNIVADMLENMDRYVLIQRLSKDCGLETKLAPEWNTYRLIVTPLVEKELARRKTRQGEKFKLSLNVDELKPLKKVD
ncbi:MAG: TIGR01212 family radical SAM protein [Candidatus Altiarchaeota archaeon]|nr:TIGR01212 family radical SAM protein [Candidatus Altiarchaeota archaeon]